MKLSEILHALSAARAAHLRWVARAEALIGGLPLDQDQVPVLPTDCQFGRWYYGAGQSLKQLGSFQSLEVPHELLHAIYQQIFHLLFGEDDRSAIGKFFGSRKNYRKKQLEEAEKLLPGLRAQSDLLLKSLDVLEKDIRQLAARKAARKKGSHQSVLESLELATSDMQGLMKADRKD